MMRIVIVGQGPFGEKVLEALIRKGEDVVGVFSPPDKRGEAMKNLAERSGISSFHPAVMKDPEAADTYLSLRPDLAVLAFVTDIIPQRLLAIPSQGTICYHPSLLPRHRGASAINWALIQGDTRTGLTIFWADKGIDTGPILLQKEVEILPEDTTGSLYFNTLFPLGVKAIVEAVDLIKKGKAPRIPQDDSKATYEPPCDDRVAAVNFEKPARAIYNLIRGCDPQPGAYILFKGKKVRFYEAGMTFSKHGLSPGEVVSVDAKGLQIAAKDGLVTAGKLRIDKGEKLGAIEAVQTIGLTVGDRLGK